MIETQGRVVATEPGFAWVECERSAACGHCAGGGSCGVSSLGKLLGARPMCIRLADPIGVRSGDDVVIGLPESGLVAAAATAYLWPLLAMIAAAVAGERLAPGTVLPILVALAGLAVGLWTVSRRAAAPAVRQSERPLLMRRTGAGCSVAINLETTGVRHE